jgi:hypothetical protein
LKTPRRLRGVFLVSTGNEPSRRDRRQIPDAISITRARDMAIGTGLGNWIGRAVALAVAAASSVAVAAPVEKPVAGQQVRFPKGYWSGLPQVGPDGKVRQCVLVALRQQRRSRYALCTEHRPRRRPCVHDP